MRFVIGLALGFGIGLAGAVLFAPERSGRTQAGWPEDTVQPEPASFSEDSSSLFASVQRALESAKQHLLDAWAEAKTASDEAERDIRARYETSARSEPDGHP